MKKTADLVKHKLRWVQPHALKMVYELRADDDVVATLRFRGWWGKFLTSRSLATAESADGCWTFKRIGACQRAATVRVSGGKQDLAVFKRNSWASSGALELADGRKYPVRVSLFEAQTQYEFQDEQGSPLIRVQGGGFIYLNADVEILPTAFTLPELPWLVMFGWYLVVGSYTGTAFQNS